MSGSKNPGGTIILVAVGGIMTSKLKPPLSSTQQSRLDPASDDAVYWSGRPESSGHGPLPGLLRNLAGESRNAAPALSALTNIARGKLSRWYASPPPAGSLPGSKPRFRDACGPLAGAWRRQWRRWRVLHGRLADRMAGLMAARGRRNPEKPAPPGR